MQTHNTIPAVAAATLLVALTGTPAQAKEWKVGLLLPFSGVYAGLGSHIENGFALGLEHFGTDLGADHVVLGLDWPAPVPSELE